MKELTVLDNDPTRWTRRRGTATAAGSPTRSPALCPAGHGSPARASLPGRSSGDIRKPNGQPYVNADDNWDWMSEHAASAARCLGYVPFDRIKDARSEEATLYIPDTTALCNPAGGDEIEVPASGEQMMPGFYAAFYGRQPYRIILITERKAASGPSSSPSPQASAANCSR